MTHKIEAGQVFGRLTAKQENPEDERTGQHWYFRCKCGRYKSIRVSSVVRGKTKSCGCLRKERHAEYLKNRYDRMADLEGVVQGLLQIVEEDLMPNIGGLAVQNYARLNDVPLKARELLADPRRPAI